MSKIHKLGTSDLQDPDATTQAGPMASVMPVVELPTALPVEARPQPSEDRPPPSQQAAGQPVAGAPAVTSALPAAASHLVITISYDASVNSINLPGAELADFKSAVQTAVNFYETKFSNPVTLTIDFGWNEVGGQTIGTDALAESEGSYASYSYQQIYNAVQADDTTSSVQLAARNLLHAKFPTDPTGPADGFEMTSAEAKIFGLAPAGGPDGHVGLGDVSWGWSQGSIGPDSFDAVGALEHEISEVMGRVADGGQQDVAGDYTLLDMFRYTAKNGQELDPIGSAAGVLDQPFVPGYNADAFSYFSYNGTTVTLPYATPSEVSGGGDVADWTGDLAAPDSYGDGFPGLAGLVSPTDLEEMNVLGYDLAHAPAPVITVSGGAAGHSPVDVNLANHTATVHFSFTVAPVSFVLADTKAVGGTLSGLSGSGASYSAIFTAAANTDIANAGVSVSANSWTGTNGDPGAGGAGAAFTVDTKTPTVAVELNSGVAGLAVTTAAVSFIFSEAPTAFSLADTATVGGTLSNLEGSGKLYTATFTAAAHTDITNGKVSVTAGSWNEINGNPGAAGSDIFTVDSVAPTGFVFTPDTAHLASLEATGSSLAAASSIGTFSAVGGPAADSYVFLMGGAARTSFTATSVANIGTLATAGAALGGTATGTVYPLGISVHDTVNFLHTATLPFDIVAGNGAGDIINLETGPANLGIAPSTPTLVYGLGGNDAISAAGMTGPVWIVGGSGADTLTGGSGATRFVYASASDSQPSGFDVITNFNVAMDKLDLTGLGPTAMAFQATQLASGAPIAKDSIAWQQSGANTNVYVNTSAATETTGTETTGHANMLIELRGDLTVSGGDVLHH